MYATIREAGLHPITVGLLWLSTVGPRRAGPAHGGYDRGYPRGMTLTTIKVSPEVRDLLKEQAAAEHRTLGEHLRYLASLADKQKRFERLRAEIDATPAKDLASYRQETAWWESAQDA